ncbi:MAG: hypothetical protein ACI90V_008804, partial [Bacillariaceae sp.]
CWFLVVFINPAFKPAKSQKKSAVSWFYILH